MALGRALLLGALLSQQAAAFTHRDCYDSWGKSTGLKFTNGPNPMVGSTIEGWALVDKTRIAMGGKHKMFKKEVRANQANDIFPVPDECFGDVSDTTNGPQIAQGGKHYDVTACTPGRSVDEMLQLCATLCSKVPGCNSYFHYVAKAECIAALAPNIEICQNYPRIGECMSRNWKKNSGFVCAPQKLATEGAYYIKNTGPKPAEGSVHGMPKITYKMGGHYIMNVDDSSITDGNAYCASKITEIEKAMNKSWNAYNSVVGARIQCSKMPTPALTEPCVTGAKAAVFFIAWVYVPPSVDEKVVQYAIDDANNDFLGPGCTMNANYTKLYPNLEADLTTELGKTVTMLKVAKSTWTRTKEGNFHARDSVPETVPNCLDDKGKLIAPMISSTFAYRTWPYSETQPEKHSPPRPLFQSQRDPDDWYPIPFGCYDDLITDGTASDPALKRVSNHFELLGDCVGDRSPQEMIRVCLTICAKTQYADYPNRLKGQPDMGCTGVNYDEMGFGGHCHLLSANFITGFQEFGSPKCIAENGVKRGSGHRVDDAALCTRNSKYTSWPLCDPLGLNKGGPSGSNAGGDCGLDNYIGVGCHNDYKSCLELGSGYLPTADGIGECVPCTAGKYSRRINKDWVNRDAIPSPPLWHNTINVCEDCPPGRKCSRQVGCLWDRDIAPKDAAHSAHNCPDRAEAGSYAPAKSPMQILCMRNEYQPETGQAECIPCPPGMMTYADGSPTKTDCVCQDGLRFDAGKGKCVDCITGMNCEWSSDIYVDYAFLKTVAVGKSGVYAQDILKKSANQTVPFVKPGYWASASDPLKIMKCGAKGKVDQCLGGNVNTNVCNQLREGKLCAECPAEHQALQDGTCTKCESGSDTAMVVGVAAAIVLALFMLHRFGNAIQVQEKISQLSSVAAVGIALQFVQVLSALNQINVDWGSSFGWFLNIVSFFALRFDLIKLQCIVPPDAIVTYVGKMVCPTICLFFMVIIAFLDNLCHKARTGEMKDEERTKRKVDAMMNSAGAIMVSFYVSISLAALSPFMCFKHPTGDSSMALYPPIQCWESSEHHALMGVAFLFTALYSIGVLAWCCLQVLMYPKKAIMGDVRFMRRNRFMFSRWEANCYFFTVCYMIRNLCVALIATVLPYDEPNIQINLFQLLLIIGLVGQLVYQPWCALALNVLDAMVTVSLLIGLNFAAVSLGIGLSEAHSIILLVVILLMFFITATYTGKKVKDTYAKVDDYAWFISHHKGTGGNTARLLKLLLSLKVKGKIFFDADDLSNLGTLCYAVKVTRNFCVIFSGEILTRKWCIAEIVTAKQCNVPTYPLQFAGEYTSTEGLAGAADKFCILKGDELDAVLASFESLSPYGISMDECKEAINNILSIEPIVALDCFEAVLYMTGELKQGGDKEQAKTAVQQARRSSYLTEITKKNRSELPELRSVLLGDCQDLEAVSVTLFLKLSLQRELQEPVFTDVQDPTIEASSVRIMANCLFVGVVVTSQIFQNTSIAARLALLYRLPPRAVQPILSAKEFAFATPDFLKNMAMTGQPMGKFKAEVEEKLRDHMINLSYVNVECPNCKEISEAHRSLFETISMPFEINYSSLEAINHQCLSILTRLKAKTTETEATMRASESNAGKEGNMEKKLSARNSKGAVVSMTKYSQEQTNELIMKAKFEDDQNPDKAAVCVCGNIFMGDSLFCRKCGTPRPDKNGAAAAPAPAPKPLVPEEIVTEV